MQFDISIEFNDGKDSFDLRGRNVGFRHAIQRFFYKLITPDGISELHNSDIILEILLTSNFIQAHH
jgi:hypothetical protein